MNLRLKLHAHLLACLAVTAIVGLSSVAVAQQRSFLLFFDFEKTEIGQGGMGIVQAVADAIKSNSKAGKIVLVGHTDTAEASSLSLVRALEAAKALVATGALPADAEISITGVGASKPLVQTGPNVHEPQNRFVAILLDPRANAGEGKASAPQAATSPPPRDALNSVIARIPGDYSCNGSNPNGSSYRCNVTISRSGEIYSFRWLIADGTRYGGKGRLRGRTLTVDWGQSAPVIYRVGDDGILRGTWANGRGTENLTPAR
jgi:hypothetical protein